MYEDLFQLEINDAGGRKAKLNINNNKIDTPYLIPTRPEFFSMNNSPYIIEENIEKFKVGTHVEWLNISKLQSILEKRNYKYYKDYILRKMDEIPSPTRLFHLEFNSDVTLLNEDNLRTLLDLQYDVGSNVIEIPNIFYEWDYNNAVNVALSWRKQNNIDKPLMGIICLENDFDQINSNIEKIDCIGMSLRRKHPLMLSRLKEMFKDKEHEIWIHGFSTPRTYRQFDWNGTIGMLVNYYGVDSISYFVTHSQAIRYSFLKHLQMTDEEKAEEAAETKYFTPENYAYNDYNSLEKEHGPDYELNNFCNCSVCRQNTIDKIKADYEYTYYNTRSHDVLGHNNEALNLKNSIEKNESEEYINSKHYANLFIHGITKSTT